LTAGDDIRGNSILTGDSSAVHAHIVFRFRFLHGMAGYRAARQGPVAVEGAVYVTESIASGRGAIDTLEFHGCRGSDGRLVLLDCAARF